MIVSFDTIKGSNKFAVKLSMVQDLNYAQVNALPKVLSEVDCPGATTISNLS